MKWITIFTFCTYTLVSSVALSQEKPQDEPLNEKRETETGEIIPVKSHDLEMIAAIEEARDTFISKYIKITTDDKIKNQITLAMVKVRFIIPTDEKKHLEENSAIDPAAKNKQKIADRDKAAEHMWVKNATFDGKVITGILASQAFDKKLPELNSIVSFKIDEISDWLIVRNGIAEGAYTVQLLRSRMDAEELLDHDSKYPFSYEKKKPSEKK